MATHTGQLTPAVRVTSLHRSFNEAGGVLNGLDLDIAPGEFVALIGRSGTLTLTVARLLTAAGIGQRIAIHVGGDAVIGRNPHEYLDALADDAGTDAVLYCGEIGGDMQTCMLEQECGNGKQQYDCDVEQCTCIQDDVPGKQCPSNDFCSSSHEEQRAAITACCGWDWAF